MKALVLFGSESDEPLFTNVCKGLKKAGFGFKLRILSAHRTSKEVETALRNEKYDFVISSAGLSNALSGVCSAQTVKPVFGIPSKNNYSGLDSLLATHQMPPGTPVIGTGVKNVEGLIEQLRLLEKADVKKIVLIKRKNSKEHESLLLKAADLMKSLGKRFIVIDGNKKNELSSVKKSIVIELIDLKSGQGAGDMNNRLRFHKKNENFSLFVPVERESNAVDSVKLLSLTNKGLWVGLNNSKNAVLAGMSFDESNHKTLKKERDKNKEKVLKADRKWRMKKW